MNILRNLMLFLALLPGTLLAQCPQHFFQGKPPVFQNKAYYKGAQLKCFQEFAVLWSQPTRVPLWSAEYLTPERMQKAAAVKRQGEFHEDPAIADGAKLSDYRRSGFDRGHMSPSADMSTLASQQESFNLANIVPQDPKQNGNQWVAVENATRSMARKQPIYVITGVVFEGQNISFLQGRVGVPTSMYKLIYAPKEGKAAAYWVDNHGKAVIQFMSLEQLEKRIGVSFGLRAQRLILPAPYARNN